MIHIESVATLAKSFSVKREKDDDEQQRVIAHLKFSECFVPRETLDELCGQPVGWSASCLFDEFGAPRLTCDIGLPRGEWSCTGTISGPDGSPSLKLLQATLDGCVLTPTKLGAVLSGSLSWLAKGDEVEDVTDMLGAICTFRVKLTDGGQGDLLGGVRAAVDRIAELGGATLESGDVRVEIPAKPGRKPKAA